MKHVGMSQSAMRAMRNEASQRLKPPKMTTCAELAIGTAIATYLRTVADSYKRLQTVADGCGGRSGVKRTRLHPQTPKVVENPSLRIREKLYNDITHYIIQDDRNRHASIHPSIYPSIFPSIYLSICIFILHNIHNMTLQCIALLCISLHHIPYRQAERERERERKKERDRLAGRHACIHTCVYNGVLPISILMWACHRARKNPKTGFLFDDVTVGGTQVIILPRQ